LISCAKTAVLLKRLLGLCLSPASVWAGRLVRAISEICAGTSTRTSAGLSLTPKQASYCDQTEKLLPLSEAEQYLLIVVAEQL